MVALTVPEVWIASSNWKGWSSVGTVSRAYVRALESTPFHVHQISTPGFRAPFPGSFELSILRQAVSAYGVGGIVHDVSGLAARRDVSVVTLHDTRPFWWNGVVWGILRSALRASCRRARAVITYTEAMRAEVGKYLGPEALRKTRVIPIPMSPTVDVPRPESEYDVLWVGRAERRKHLTTFLEAVSRLPTSISVAILWSPSGWLDGEDPREIRRLISSERSRGRALTEIPSGIPETALDLLYRRSRCLVSTSDYEGFHAPPMEAYLRGVRLVLPRLPIYAETYPNADGVAFYEDADGLDTEMRGAVGASNTLRPSSRVVDAVSYTTTGRQLVELYESLSRTSR